LAVPLLVGALWAVSAVDSEAGKAAVVVTCVKIAISLVQVLTQLEFALDLVWPGSFRYVLTFLAIFLLGVLGCWQDCDSR
jgi:hypothetical protein